MNNVVNLSDLNDRQKIWLSQVSYLKINEEGKKIINNGGLSLYELQHYLEEPNTSFVGNAWMSDESFDFVVKKMTGGDKLATQLDVLNSLISSGLGNLKITNVEDFQNTISNGFQAMVFEDSFGNTGISYRGSDFNFSEGGLRDWVESDFLEYLKNDSPQRKEALEYFNKHKNKNGNNYIYGHSLGGNLTSYVYVENYNEIQEAFTINGTPINQKLLDTPGKLAAFNDPKKYNCNVICGDIVGNLKSCKAYENNVKYIKNNGTMDNTIASAHLVQAATFDKNGNFIKANKKEMKKTMGLNRNVFITITQTLREILNSFEQYNENIKEQFEQYKSYLFDSFKEKFEELGYYDTLSTLEEFKKSSKDAELELIEKIKNKIMYQQLDSDIQIQKEEMMSDMVIENEVSVRTR